MVINKLFEYCSEIEKLQYKCANKPILLSLIWMMSHAKSPPQKMREPSAKESQHYMSSCTVKQENVRPFI